MISLFVFILDAGLFSIFARFARESNVRPDRPRPLGFAFVIAALFAALAGWVFHAVQHIGDPANAAAVSAAMQSQGAPGNMPGQPGIIDVPTRRGIPAD